MGCFGGAGSGNLDCMKDIMDSLKYHAMIQDCRREATEASTHLQAPFIGGYKE